jgi:hypothetical protein
VVVGIVAGAVITALVAWAFHRWGTPSRRPTYVVTGNRVVAGDPKRGIEVTFRGERVPVVSRTLVAVWNDGREPIRQVDVPNSAPLTIHVDGADRILDMTIVAVTRPEIGFHARVEPPRQVVLSFDHLDHKDGATVEILHTGPNPYRVGLTGDVIGTQGRLSELVSPLWDDPGGFKGSFAAGCASLGFAAVAALARQFITAAGLVAGALALVTIALNSRKQDRRRVPNALWSDVPGGFPYAPSFWRKR